MRRWSSWALPAGRMPGVTSCRPGWAAFSAGSDYLVIGRPISQAADPAKALAAIVAELG